MADKDSSSTLSKSMASTLSHSTQDWPLNKDNEDTLIPSLADVHRTFSDGKATWETLLGQATIIPSGLWPEDALNPYTTLAEVPSLPQRLPHGGWLYGRPCWELPIEIGGTSCEGHDPNADLALVHGRRVVFRLRNQYQIRCMVCPDAASFALGVGSETTNSLSVLVICWSYILSVRLLEIQGRQVYYSVHRLWPKSSQCQSGHVIDLEGASPPLIRWLCAILSPKMGWQARDQGGLPTWTTSLTTDVNICIKASVLATEAFLPPSSSEATELLIELCQLFGLAADTTDVGSGLTPMQPYKASFLAALMLPFYNFTRLVPRLPPPNLTRPRSNGILHSSHKQIIRWYLDDMGYFMTLSLHPPSIGSILWSIFWQPDIDCNLVSPWLASILETLDPVIQKKHVEVLVKVFLSRRPRIAIWWVALFLLGDLAVLDWIRRYAVKMEEKYASGSLSPLDPMVSAWTGSKQSFLDLERDSIYTEQDDLVSKADLLRCRFDLKLQDSAGSNLSWQPFGYIQKRRVELELWPQLETMYSRKYHSFTWYVDKKQPISDKGFRVRTGRNMGDVSDNLGIVASSIGCVKRDGQNINVRPSRESTLRMMSFLVEDVVGSRNWANADMPNEREKISWLRDWEGVDVMDRAPADVEEESAKAPSRFLEEWIRDKYQ